MRTNLFTPRQTGRWIAGACLAALLVMSISGCKKSAPVQLPPPEVQVMEVYATNVPLTAEIIGQLDSPQNVEVRARVEAFVDKMLFEEGKMVEQGAPLFQLDSRPYQEQLAAAKGMLGEAKAALKKSEADVARLKPLAEKRAVPQQDLDNALAAVEVGKASVVSAEARVQSAELDLSYCDVRAPITGLIGAKQVSIGDLVGKGQPTLMATISTLNPIWVYCSVSEVGLLDAAEYSRRTGKRLGDAKVSLILANGVEHRETGKLVFIDRAVDPTTGTMRIRAEFPNPTVPPDPLPLLRPGMFGRIRVDLGTRPDSVLIPERAVTQLQGKYFVWVIDADNKATQRRITVGQQFGESLLVVEGLKAGERIVEVGQQKVREGGAVRPKTAKEMAEAAAQHAAAEGAAPAKGNSVQPSKE